MAMFPRCRQRLKRLSVRAVCLLWVVIAIWGAAWVPQANADSVGVGSEKAAAIVRERAANELDRVAGQGSSDFIEGIAQESLGKAKRKVGQLTDDVDSSVDGAADQLEGSLKRDVGSLKNKAENIGDDLGDAAEDALDSVRDFFD
ncbi:MAG: hypothetical protein AAF810_17890 [Cyanobacteria bacterium P01_D01_bin.36]